MKSTLFAFAAAATLMSGAAIAGPAAPPTGVWGGMADVLQPAKLSFGSGDTRLNFLEPGACGIQLYNQAPLESGGWMFSAKNSTGGKCDQIFIVTIARESELLKVTVYNKKKAMIRQFLVRQQ